MSCCPDASCALNVSGLSDHGSYGAAHEAELKTLARDLGDGLFQNDFTIPGMHCSACIRTIETGLSALPAVQHVRANLSLRRVSVQWRKQNPDDTPLGRIEETLTKLGFPATPFDFAHIAREDDKTGRQLTLSLAVSGFAAMNIMLLSVSVWSGADAATAQLSHLISGVIAVPSVIFAGRPFYASAWNGLRVGRLNMDVPISLAVLLALSMSIFESLTGGEEAYFDAAVMLLFFLLIGRTLDHMMRKRARGAVERLGSLSSRGASVITANGESLYHVLDDITPGMTLRIPAGERLPVDARLISSSGNFDSSMVSGESEPVTLHAGEEIEAGALNLTGSIDICVLRPADQSFIAEVIELMEAAEGGRSHYVRIADRMAKIYAPAVHLLALFAFIGWMIATSGDWHYALYTAISVLIITCPCALGLAVPVVHVIAATRLFKEGILMKDGAALERLAEVDTILFDKTGTLTTGIATVRNVDGNLELMATAQALAGRSTHPAARTIAHYLDETLTDRGIDLAHYQEIPGCGIEAEINGVIHRLGRAQWVAEIAADAPVLGHQNAGVFCAAKGGAVLFFEFEETLRADARPAFQALRATNLSLGILSGDAAASVAKIAKILAIDHYSYGNSPKDKVQEITHFNDRGQRVLMVGDGLNDAAALSSGYASMAPASACDIGRLAADFVYTRNNLMAVASAFKIARLAARLVKQNFALALLYNCIAVPLALAGYVTPLIAAVAMSASSIVVVLNSLRLNIVRLDRSQSSVSRARATSDSSCNIHPTEREVA